MKKKDIYELFPKGGIGAETGVLQGVNARELFDVTQPEKMYLIDCWSPVPSWELNQYDHYMNMFETIKRFEKEIRSGRVEIIKGTTFDKLSSIPKLDWIYIDDDHREEACEFVLNWANDNVASVIAGHDYLEKIPIGHDPYWYGVKRAVDKFVDKFDWYIAKITMEKFPSFLLQRK